MMIIYVVILMWTEPEAKKHRFRGNQQTAQMITTQRTRRVTFLFARMVSGRERSDELDALELLVTEVAA